MLDIAIIYEYKKKGGLGMYAYSFVRDAQKMGFRWQRVRCYNANGDEVGFFDYDIQAPGWITLQKLFVAKAFRGNGIASILIKHFLELSFYDLRANYVSVYFFPTENGISVSGLIKLFQKHGFEITGRKLSEAKGSLKLEAFLNNNS
jgi:ribosomal protein S18 acetylase RimI-like enzyme